MNPTELSKKKKNSPAVAIQRFVLLKKEFNNDLFCFYEGKDGPYYYNRIINHFGDNHHPITCGNKKAVLKVYEYLKINYSNSNTSFFVDKDYDEQQNQSNLYETPCYSIENFYTSVKVLKAVLKNEFLLSETDKEYKDVIELFVQNKNDFHSSITLLNSWYAAAKQIAQAKGTSVNASLDEKPPKEFIIIKIGKIQSDYDFSKIIEKYPNSIEVTEAEVQTKMSEFNTKDKSQIFRGKYELDFMYNFLKFIIEDANNSKDLIKTKTSFNIDKARILSQLSQYAETPDCLVEYINSKNSYTQHPV
ncbi:MAG: DUF4435 domain-containing protein [Polaribacter sp.]|uniref:DUF4435 domain-containing protein n=1 Tax=Polaribacter sp. TaxID=1920175 RepID=UPI003EF51212